MDAASQLFDATCWVFLNKKGITLSQKTYHIMMQRPLCFTIGDFAGVSAMYSFFHVAKNKLKFALI